MIRDLLPTSEAESASTTAVRLMAAVKVFGRWAADISADWNVKVRQQCLELIEGPNLSELVVHERVSGLARQHCFQQADSGDMSFPIGIELVPPFHSDTKRRGKERHPHRQR
jgi:hypothetical protein